MRRTRLLTIGIITGIGAVLALGATYYPGGMARFYGDTVLTILQPGAVYYNTASNWWQVGSMASNPVVVGKSGVATTNDINTAIAPLATTNFVNASVAGYLPTNTVFGVTTNIGLLDLSTNGLTLYFTNGSLQGVSQP
jgi:hypothetical protein